jgi:hypothetical protein
VIRFPFDDASRTNSLRIDRVVIVSNRRPVRSIWFAAGYDRGSGVILVRTTDSTVLESRIDLREADLDGRIAHRSARLTELTSRLAELCAPPSVLTRRTTDCHRRPALQPSSRPDFSITPTELSAGATNKITWPRDCSLPPPGFSFRVLGLPAATNAFGSGPPYQPALSVDFSPRTVDFPGQATDFSARSGDLCARLDD